MQLGRTKPALILSRIDLPLLGSGSVLRSTSLEVDAHRLSTGELGTIMIKHNLTKTYSVNAVVDDSHERR